jgi:UDP-4-amino-4,6-dideoxy-N-acetyl-beta-L-altrosamine transaminase
MPAHPAPRPPSPVPPSPVPSASSGPAGARPLPYGRQWIEEDDIAAVVEALRSDLLAQGPRAEAFERDLAVAVQAPEAVTCSSGTAALHLALAGLGVGPGDVCVAPAVTFLSTATSALMCGAEVVFADVDPLTGLMTPQTLADALERGGPRVRAALPVHLGGRMCDMPALARVAAARGVALVEDACHALGSARRGSGPAGASRWSAASVFSFHPVKTIACGEGGAVTTRDGALAARMRRLRNHGVTRDAALMVDPELSLDTGGAANPWAYEQLELGFNYRMTDLEAALGRSQLRKLDRFRARRAALARTYDALLAPLAPLVRPVAPAGDETPCLHLYGVAIDFAGLGVDRASLMRSLAARGVGTQVHYIPVYRQPAFVSRYGVQRLPGAEAYFAANLSLPLFPAMDEADVQRVVLELARALGQVRLAA